MEVWRILTAVFLGATLASAGALGTAHGIWVILPALCVVAFLTLDWRDRDRPRLSTPRMAALLLAIAVGLMVLPRVDWSPYPIILIAFAVASGTFTWWALEDVGARSLDVTTASPGESHAHT
ncbi:hypothetical protein B6D25_06080 [Micrococcus luteus]|uniref:Uncharacterized protein n=3 Tax=Micrococcus luteus TaxID=1270 RepID=C5CD16_MICLC|nr:MULTISPECIES: hypothetical protein [Micrococcus]ACS31368.1 hypothetical protein Mlut_18850 [Micrococcus luteus NCTC 2665]AJO56428.1 hypothetical protein BF96_09535 [Micrococcus luteus]KAB1900575.1 hypothetical protein F8198_09470 [Micrococcus luteus NCTC 2665]MCK6095347.1 hypothetical protein [Micrococcus sp. EYE_212]MCK6171381.1 hypothetical protein [Micrococcus sp. EYE_162]